MENYESNMWARGLSQQLSPSVYRAQLSLMESRAATCLNQRRFSRPRLPVVVCTNFVLVTEHQEFICNTKVKMPS